jgi:type II secretion system protein G
LDKRERGFSLIELLIAMAIIGILAAIAIPNLLTAVQRGKQKRTMSDMRALATAIEAYAVDNSQYPLATSCPTGLSTIIGTVAVIDASSFSLLTPTYAAQPPKVDGWGAFFQYSNDSANYAILSTGSDKAKQGLTANCGTTTSFNSDIVYADGSFVQWPEGIQD